MPPPAPGPESWEFRKELQQEEPYNAKEAYRLDDRYGLEGNLETVKSDLERFFASAGKPAEKTLRLIRADVDGRESYRIDVAADGSVEIAAGDDDGMRRAAYYFQDRLSAGDLRSCRRRPWLSKRISRCYFSPIKRPPFNRDELADDIDYYPEAYLNRLAHEGVNGLWLTVELRDVVETSFAPRREGAEKRLLRFQDTARCQCNNSPFFTFHYNLLCLQHSPMLHSKFACMQCKSTTYRTESGVFFIYIIIRILKCISICIPSGEDNISMLSFATVICIYRELRLHENSISQLNTITGSSISGNSEKSSHLFQFTSDFCSFDQIRCTVFSDRQCRCHTGCLTDTADGWHDPDAAVQCVIHRDRTASH